MSEYSRISMCNYPRVPPPLPPAPIIQATTIPIHHTKNLSARALQLETLDSKRPPLVSNRDHFLGYWFLNFLLFSTFSKQPLDARYEQLLNTEL